MGEENYFFENITISNISNGESVVKNMASKIKEFGVPVLKTLTVVTTFFSISKAVTLVKLIQMVDYLRYLNINHPEIFTLMVGVFSRNVFKDTPNYFTVLTDDHCQPLEAVYKDNGLRCQFYENTGPIFLILIAFFLFKYVLKLYSWRTTNYDRLWPYQKPFYYINKKVSFEFIYNLFNLFCLDLYIAAAINIRKYDFTSKNSTFNVLTSIFAFIFLIGSNLFLYYATIKGEDAVRNLKKLKK